MKSIHGPYFIQTISFNIPLHAPLITDSKKLYIKILCCSSQYSLYQNLLHFLSSLISKNVIYETIFEAAGSTTQLQVCFCHFRFNVCIWVSSWSVLVLLICEIQLSGVIYFGLHIAIICFRLNYKIFSIDYVQI